jgi:HEPN/Toprim N-terminal domain 1
MAEFECGKAEHLDYLRELNENSDLWDEEIALLERSAFSDFLEAFREIVTSGIHPLHFSERKPDASMLAVHILKSCEDFYWGFPCRDIRSFFRALLEVVPESALVTQDLTDLVSGGYYDEADDVCERSLEELKGDYSVNSRIILLTEGPTDSEVLRAGIEILYPHLSDYYSFMDLAVRAPGGAGSLVHVVKSFAGAGIENRTIALFDNDAAGHSAASLLRHIQLPPNILVINYPNIALADSYPTRGPNGESVQDVNGSACSIELYFGRDVLTIDGRLVPVQWKAYDERVKRYQGEIQHKDLLKDRFLQKTDAAKRNGLQTAPGDWEDMRRLLESVFDAFHAQQCAAPDA